MELIKAKYRVRCEMGVCKNPAKYTVALSRAGIKSRIHICDECRRQLSAVTSDASAALADASAAKTEKRRAKSFASNAAGEQTSGAAKRKKPVKRNEDL